MNKEISTDVYNDIRAFIDMNIEDWQKDAEEFEYIDLTVAISDDGSKWNYQTGDNSFTGGAYSLPIWGVTSIYPNSTAEAVASEIINQIEDQFFQ